MQKINLQTLKTPPKSESELLERCDGIEGLTFLELSQHTSFPIPQNPMHRKGWIGQAIEYALGADAGNASQPDFLGLGIELKTIPINPLGNPAESTFVTSIPLLTIHKQIWESSQCFQKLKRVLWVPVEGDRALNFHERRVGRSILWSPTEEERSVLARDWNELTMMIRLGRLVEVDSRQGEYLQIRPKAANARQLCFAVDQDGQRIQTLPRGFYLRSSFTKRIILTRNAIPNEEMDLH